MIKNKSSQVVQAFLISKEGDAVATGTTTVKVIGDGVSTGGSGTVTNTGAGIWTYEPSQAETNFNDVIYLFANVLAVTQPVHYSPRPETIVASNMVDISGLMLASSYIAPNNAGIADLVANQGNWLTATGFATVNFDDTSIINAINNLNDFDYTTEMVSADTIKINTVDVIGTGVEGDEWRA